MRGELKEKVSGEVCGIKLQYCLISLGKSLCMCVFVHVCTERGVSTWHFIFELIACCPVALPAARLLSENLPLSSSSPFLLQINQMQNQITIRRDSEQWYRKKKYRAEGTLKQNPKSSGLEREEREPFLPITFLLGGKQSCRLSLGICLNPAQE